MVEVVVALIWDKDKFLICQRPENKGNALLWEFVGGKVEKGETKEEALIRECREELDIILSVDDEFMDVVHEYPDITVHLTLFNAEIKEGVPKKLEHNDIKWITVDEMDKFDFCPADTVLLDKIKSERRDKMINKLLKSVLDQDTAPVVVCDIDDCIRYMNPCAIKRYHKDLTGESIKKCHPPKANEMIDRVISWFKKSKDNNIVYTYRNDEENKDVYMVALRDDDGTLIGYYEKHDYRNRETLNLYEMK